MSSDINDQAPPLLVSTRAGVCRIIFNRPATHNAQNVEMLQLLDRELDRLRWDREARVVVLTGAGDSFTSGHDLRSIRDDEEYRRNASTVEGRIEQEARLFVEPVRKFRELPVPTICQVRGHCLAAGMMFVGAADFVLADRTARFGSPIMSRLAVNDAEVAAFTLKVGEQWAKRVIWLDERLSAEQAHSAGLVTWVAADDRELERLVDELVTKIVAAPREALALSKASMLFMAEMRGEQATNRFHFLAHQLSHWTQEAQEALAKRIQSLDQGQRIT